jgi:hypothetical protein
MENLNYNAINSSSVEIEGPIMANFGFDDLAEDAIQPQRRGSAEVEKIFDKYVRLTLEKIDQSISDAKGRYEESKAYTMAKPSQNWKVVKQAENLLDEELKIWLKIGIKKQGLYKNQNGVEVLEAKIKAKDLMKHLLSFKQSIEFVRDNRDTSIAREFHEVAIAQAKPKSKPAASQNPGKTDWQYDSESDSYIAI